MGPRLQPANHCQHPRTQNRTIEFGNIWQDRVAIAIAVFAKLALSDRHRQVKQFDVLDDRELVGRSEFTIANFSLIDFINERFVDAVRRKRLAQLAFVALLAALFRLLAAVRLLLRWLDDVTGRRF